MNMQPVEMWDSRGIGNKLFGLDMFCGEPCFVVMGVEGPSGREMLAQFSPELVEIAETMAIEANLAHDGIGRLMEVNIRVSEN